MGLIPKYDKMKHLYFGMFLFIGLTFLAPPAVALAGIFFIAVAKELVYDWLLGNGTPEIMDVFWTVFFPGLLTLSHSYG